MNYDKRKVSYELYGKMMDDLVSKIKTYGNDFDYVFGKPRGAWPIITHLSHQLQIPIWYAVNGINESVVSNTVRISEVKILPEGSNLLIADDICDHGYTFDGIKKEADGLGLNTFFVCLFKKPIAKFDPDIYIEETTQWIVFPWERYDEEPNR